MTTATLTLTEFLLARIAEDEETARWAASVYRGDGTLSEWHRDPHHCEVVMMPANPSAAGLLLDAGLVVSDGEAERWSRPHGPVVDEAGGHAAEHIAAWDPSRVLAECEAKRRIVEQCDKAWQQHRPNGTPTEWGHHVWGGLNAACRALASVYADHPDYREDWRP